MPPIASNSTIAAKQARLPVPTLQHAPTTQRVLRHVHSAKPSLMQEGIAATATVADGGTTATATVAGEAPPLQAHPTPPRADQNSAPFTSHGRHVSALGPVEVVAHREGGSPPPLDLPDPAASLNNGRGPPPADVARVNLQAGTGFQSAASPGGSESSQGGGRRPSISMHDVSGTGGGTYAPARGNTVAGSSQRAASPAPLAQGQSSSASGGSDCWNSGVTDSPPKTQQGAGRDKAALQKQLWGPPMATPPCDARVSLPGL